MGQYEVYNNSLKADKYEPLPSKIMNQMVMDYNESGDEGLLSDIINRNLRLVVSVVMKSYYWKTDVEIMDLIGVGNEKLLKMVKSYSYDSVDFGYYAFVGVTNEIKTYLRDYGHTVKGTKIGDKRFYSVSASMDDYDVAVDGGEYELNNHSEIIELLSGLEKTRQQDIDLVIYHLGFVDGVPKNYKETGKHFGFNSERARQTYKRVIDRLKKDKKLTNILKHYL